MLIDWFTVIAQLVNFAILIWLLRRFLFKPILRAIDEREKRIARQLAEAEDARKEAERQSDVYRQKNENFDRQLAERMAEMSETAAMEKQRLQEETKAEAARLSEQRQATLEKEALEFEHQFRSQMGETLIEIAGKAIQDLAGISLEDRMIEVFLEQIASVSPEERLRISGKMKSPEPVIVSSAHDIEPEQSKQVAQAVRDYLTRDAKILFEKDPALVCGLEIRWGGYRLTWSLAEYMSSLQKNLSEATAM